MKIDIKYNKHEYKNSVVYISLGFRMGLTTKYFKLRTGEVLKCNLAFSHILVNIIKKYGKLFTDFNVGRTVSTFSLKTSTDNMFSDIVQAIKLFETFQFTENLFDEIKEETLENFKKVFKSGEFRARYKVLEITDISKGYTFGGLIYDLANFEYKEFVELYETLVKNGKCIFYINGNIRDLNHEELQVLTDLSNNAKEASNLSAKVIDNYILEDSHIRDVARTSTNVSAVRLSYNKNIEILDRFLWTTIEGERIPLSDKEVYVDEYDASITITADCVLSLKNYIKNEISEDSFNKAKSSLLLRFYRQLEKNPIYFANNYIDMYFCDCSLYEYLEILDKLTYESYVKVSKEIRPMVTEAQVVMRRESL